MAHRFFPHGELSEIAPSLWQVEGSLPMPLKRNMKVYRLGDGQLVLYSVVAMDEAGMAALEALGKPAVMIAPHPIHILDAPFYNQRYPDLTVIASGKAIASRSRKRPRTSAPPRCAACLSREQLPAHGPASLSLGLRRLLQAQAP
jgi:hypothetical protein